MSVVNRHISIPKNISTENDLDYSYLRKIGIEYLEQFGGSLWTDFNDHDPGITILEMVAYAITDLGMRIDMPIEDILTSEDPLQDINNQFFKASEVLPTSPVTELDYRKLFIDLNGVKNCWLSKHKKKVYADCKNDLLSYDPNKFNSLPAANKREFELKGLYDIYVDFEDVTPLMIKSIKEKIKEQYHNNRNLCEDLVNIDEIGEYPIKLCADIEVDSDADEEKVHALILTAMEDYFSPSLCFYSLREMINKGYSTVEIFDGPILEHGFIDSDELTSAKLRSEVRLSDIMKLIMAIPGVLLIKDISIGNCGTENDYENVWLICLEEYQKPVLCEESVFNYNKGVLPLNINDTQVQTYLDEIREEKDLKVTISSQDKEIEIPDGQYLETDSYTTVQNDFPDTYGINQAGLPARSNVARKSQAKQLKAYLLFFDQILGSYFKHLGTVNQLLSVKGSIDKTYFTQAINDIVGLDELISDYSTDDDNELTNTLFQQLDNSVQRRNEILDHLLARFAERFSDYAFIMKTIYGSSSSEVVLKNKEDFLKDYKAVSKDRGNSFNYYHQLKTNLWNTINVSGLEKRISRLLGIKDYRRRHLSKSFVELYRLTNTDNEEVFRWRIRDLENNIVLSATDEYTESSSAIRELYFAVLQITQTRENKVEAVFDEGFTDQADIDNIHIHQSVSGKYSFDIINPAITSKSSPNYIIAKRYTYYQTKDELKQSILDLIRFIKEDFTEEGMFIVEHILLRPDVGKTTINADSFLPIQTDDCSNCEHIDPYSYRISIIIPGYTFRFFDTDFRALAERIIKEELPAHVMAKICWVGYRENEVEDPKENDLLVFENAFKEYLYAKSPLEQGQPNLKLTYLIKAIARLSNVYPVGRLFDCDDESDELGGKVILGKTNLGSL